ncbi:DUF1934 domain-containing protein [Alkalibacter rhizosphaerae]|uniref:DUF1934 domain-containing protein n=1 Tax=Alkalibacter rhizosphaerae TaxID=2815577 RepID=A0A975AH73_9FIRM|nr:DUF1934 domain-containing protein [Alkalibacter rhizosphaerae]QSX08152.1 DUF1934 domain-containing protein [Alkalibacter rhizosphaerae]
MEKKKIWLSITGRTKHREGMEDVIELVTQGELYRKSNSDYIIYDETEVSGLEGTTTTLEIDRQKMSIMRLGSTNSHMTFETGKKKFNTYTTPYGDMVMSIYTRNLAVDYDKDDQPVDIRVDYNVEIQGLMETTNELNIHVKQ